MTNGEVTEEMAKMFGPFGRAFGWSETVIEYVAAALWFPLTLFLGIWKRIGLFW